MSPSSDKLSIITWPGYLKSETYWTQLAQDGVHIAIDYRYVNKHCEGDVCPLPNTDDVIQRFGKTAFDLKGAYLNIPVKPEHLWLTASVWDEGLYEFKRAPFGHKGSGCTFVCVIQQVLQPIKEFADSYVDDISVFSDQWRSHFTHLERFPQVVKNSGFTLNLKKACLFKVK